jgi:hypothetical protein
VGLRAFSLKNEVSPKVSPFGISSLMLLLDTGASGWDVPSATY